MNNNTHLTRPSTKKLIDVSNKNNHREEKKEKRRYRFYQK